MLDYEIEEANNSLLRIQELYDAPNKRFGKNELKEFCRDFGLPVSGNKDDLLNRLVNYSIIYLDFPL